MTCWRDPADRMAMAKKLSAQIIPALALTAGSVNIMAIEEASYTVALQDDKFEIRDYAPQILAETFVEGTLEDAGSKAFNRLLRYISGENRHQSPAINQSSIRPWVSCFTKSKACKTFDFPAPFMPIRQVNLPSRAGSGDKEKFTRDLKLSM